MRIVPKARLVVSYGTVGWGKPGCILIVGWWLNGGSLWWVWKEWMLKPVVGWAKDWVQHSVVVRDPTWRGWVEDGVHRVVVLLGMRRYVGHVLVWLMVRVWWL